MPPHTPRTSLALLALALGLSGLVFLRRLATGTAHVMRDTVTPAASTPELRPEASLPPEPPAPSPPATPIATTNAPAQVHPLGPPSAAHAAPEPGGPAERSAEARAEAAAFRAVVPVGGALVTGGWRQPDGRRVLVLASPLVMTGDQVQVDTEFIAAPESALADPGWARMLEQADGKLRLEGGVFDAEGLQAFRSQLASGSAFEALSSPRLTMLYDQLASLEISSVGNGFMMSLIATRRDDGRAVELAVSTAEFHQRAPATTQETP